MTAAAGAYNESDLALDSTFFVAFDLTHRALKGGLAAASPLNVTQYRMLVKLLAAGPDGVAQSDLGRLLDLKPNVVTQALNALEEAGFAERLRGEGADGRTRTARATGAGEEHVARANASIVERLYALFPTEDADHRAILEASIAAGASIDPPLSGDVASRFAASRALVSLELVKRAMEGALRRAAGAPLAECRVLQRLGEVGEPLRVGDVATQLQMSPVAVARAVDGLVGRGWARRLASPSDRKAVFVAATDEGARKQKVIARTVDALARTQLWARLDDDRRRALARTWRVVIADVQARKELDRKAALELLQPIE
ncbi:MAG: MarR family transcriptional regulator [Gordonibacter pamelaeae]|uniref:MarR family transcriptional regulator n=1 Tax=Gordonibacter pamelaeae TaxID=471189 RepID=UPI0012B08E66|nr:MarR family transcriptional regulator [Gordonibacter pamelaeae]MCB6311984.1 MarR family transcriptional regulator [Gordonibacter pamelaeae]MCQ4846832.1 MarR family transcriptional regulator [Gordonibacter pamelaeae]MCQ4849830.1 MarR family transcriptional regulator [Gordonibacter pamelaeae]MSA61299.1 MarR family transcriptional regulator [Gordonibacter pamelaeae]